MEVTDQPIAASEVAAMQPVPDMTELPEPAPMSAGKKEFLPATKGEVDQVANAVMALSNKINQVHSDLGQFEAFKRDFAAFLEFNGLKLPPVSGEKTKFSGVR